ncbi:PPP family 3-phenylpropionic acid transporter [Paenibacillus taihuensis]|uniref:PPP family 3-phenylpropionic acid transporter n=1 Tax=Paenibacillus taihuensis TaxID=1156355 RepID=A0A3D9RYT8_9BACL|nr:MFS transporter [Paenibacillus taihuensis]REE82724.1 PPP family 3-phenylpropionic acid transporter [Paenibacillus taihuensis]
MGSTAASDSIASASAHPKREVLTLRIFLYLVYTTQAIVGTYLPLYFLDKGFSASQIGVVYSCGPFISIFANLIFGTASDKFRTIQKIMTLLMLGQLVMISMLFTTNTFALICVIMLAYYFFQMPVIPLSDSLILLSSRYTGTPFALIRLFGSIGFAMSAFLGGQLLKSTGSAATVPLAMCSIGLGLLVSVMLKDYQGSTRKVDFSGFLKLLRKPDILIYFAIILVLSIAHRMNEGFLAVTLREMGAGDSLVGLAWMTSAISEIPILYLLGKYGHKFKELPLLAIASVMYAIRFFLISEISSPIWIIPIQAMHSVTFGIFLVTALRYLTSIIPDEFRSSGQAVYAIVWSGFAGVISGTVGGVIFEHFGSSDFFKTATVLSLIAAAAFLVKHYFRRDH